MRANQPMGLTPAAHTLLEGLVPIDSGRTYEGYFDAEYPLLAYLRPTAAMVDLLAERAGVAARLAEIDGWVEDCAKAALAAGAYDYAEYEQAVLYSSGPCMFLALRDAAGAPVAAALWSECAMEAGAEGVCYCGGSACAPDCAEGCRSAAEYRAERGF